MLVWVLEWNFELIKGRSRTGVNLLGVIVYYGYIIVVYFIIFGNRELNRYVNLFIGSLREIMFVMFLYRLVLFRYV